MARFAIALFSVLLTFFSADAAARQPVHRNPARSRRVVRQPKPEPVFDPNAINTAQLVEPVGPDSAGSAVVRAEVLLDRAHFSPGQIDGRYNENVKNAIAAYQSAHGLNADGIVQPDTWAALNADTGPILVPYTIVDQDLAGPFSKIPSEMIDKAKLPQLGYQDWMEELGERVHASPKFLREINKDKDLNKAGEQILIPNVGRGPLAGQPALVAVKRATKSVEVLDASGKVIAHYPASMGSEHDPLPIGEWKLSKPIKNPHFHYNSDLFWDASEKHEQATLPPGPNSPVGVVWIGLSKEHYGLHGTPEPGNIGKTMSHGCIRLTNWDAWELSDLVQPGMTASLRES